MKEKIGIEKLIELLNEYETPRSGVVYKSYDDYDGFFYGVDCDGETEIAWSDSLICSKKFGWIGWLVENEKIDRDNAKLRKSLWETDTSDIDKIIYTIKNSDYHYVMREAPYDSEESLLMLLSIQDEPINFLISILK